MHILKLFDVTVPSKTAAMISSKGPDKSDKCKCSNGPDIVNSGHNFLINKNFSILANA